MTDKRVYAEGSRAMVAVNHVTVAHVDARIDVLLRRLLFNEPAALTAGRDVTAGSKVSVSQPFS